MKFGYHREKAHIAPVFKRKLPAERRYEIKCSSVPNVIALLHLFHELTKTISMPCAYLSNSVLSNLFWQISQHVTPFIGECFYSWIGNSHTLQRNLWVVFYSLNSSDHMLCSKSWCSLKRFVLDLEVCFWISPLFLLCWLHGICIHKFLIFSEVHSSFYPYNVCSATGCNIAPNQNTSSAKLNKCQHVVFTSHLQTYS